MQQCIDNLNEIKWRENKNFQVKFDGLYANLQLKGGVDFKIPYKSTHIRYKEMQQSQI